MTFDRGPMLVWVADRLSSILRTRLVCRWLPGVKPGEIAASFRNPVVYSKL